MKSEKNKPEKLYQILQALVDQFEIFDEQKYVDENQVCLAGIYRGFSPSKLRESFEKLSTTTEKEKKYLELFVIWRRVISRRQY